MANDLIFGVAKNDAGYAVKKWKEGRRHGAKRTRTLVWMCPYYHRWMDMLKRCYSRSWKADRPTYKDCSVCPEWLVFSSFKRWMERQDWEGKALDKDLLAEGNKIYSPETCVFITPSVNAFIRDGELRRNSLPIGVSLDKRSGTYKASCRGDDGKQKHLGYYSSPEGAHAAWKREKLRRASVLAESQNDPRVRAALLKRYQS